MVKLSAAKLEDKSIEQYKNEERAALAKRIISAENRIKRILGSWDKIILLQDVY
jgi:hypothetical protein